MSRISFHFFSKELRKLLYFLRAALDLLRFALRTHPSFSAEIVFCLAHPGSTGGTELQIALLAQDLKKKNIPCAVLTCGKIERENQFLLSLHKGGIDSFHLGYAGLIPFHRFPFLRRSLEKKCRSIFPKGRVCHFFNPASTSLASLFRPFFSALAYMETGLPSKDLWRESLAANYAAFDWIASVSKAGLERLEKIYGPIANKSVLGSLIEAPPKGMRARRPVLGAFHVVYFGRMTPKKGVAMLLRSFSAVRRKIPHAALSLIGEGEFLPDLKKLARRLDLGPAVLFHGNMGREELFMRMATADLFCLPSESEGMPCSILEAMAIGLPAIATQVGAIPDLIEDRKSGILIAPKDEEALTTAILELACDLSLRERLAEESYRRFQSIGGNEKILSQLENFYAPFRKI